MNGERYFLPEMGGNMFTKLSLLANSTLLPHYVIQDYVIQGTVYASYESSLSF